MKTTLSVPAPSKTTPNITPPKTISTPTTFTSSSGSIPFNVFMETVNNNPKTYDIILDALNKQSHNKRYDYPTQAAPISTSGKYVPPSHAIQSKASMKQMPSHDSLLIAPSKSVPGTNSSKMAAPSVPKSVPVSVNSFASRNTSPFKAQTTIVSNPASDTPHQSIGGVKSHDINATPPPAHSRRSRTTSEWSSGDEPEIIDLTTPPRKSDSLLKKMEVVHQPKAQKPAEEMYFVPRTVTTNYPMPPKKNIQARQRNISSESSEDPEVMKR
jgi:hypothetical protein